MSNPERCNVLITIAGRKGYQVRALKTSPRAGSIVACDADARAPVRRDTAFECVPRVDEPAAYLEALQRICERESIHCILPVNDLDVELLAQAHGSFHAQGVRVLAPSLETTRALCDKLEAASWFAARGFSTPETLPIELLREGHRPAWSVHFPLFAKPRRGQGSRGVRILRQEAELAAVPDGHIVQPFIAGDHYDLDLLRAADGRTVAVVPKRKLEMSDGTASLTESADDPALMALGERLSDAIGHVGAVDVDLIVHDGRISVLEVNARLGGCFPFACLFCPQLADALLDIGLGASPPSLLGSVRAGVRAFRDLDFVQVP
jgi:carbamoyl-phosphate synthase large subunit